MSRLPGVSQIKKKEILIIEDDDAVAALLTRTLQLDYRVVRVSDGPDALVRLKAGEMPSLLVLDVSMPTGDGFAVARTVRTLQGGARVPIIFLSASDGPMDVIKAIQHGARHYVTKPFQPIDLLDKIKKTVAP